MSMMLVSANVEKWRKLSADEDEKVEQLKAEEETLFQVMLPFKWQMWR